jgi:glycosyltransferase 2 family protein
LKKFIINFVQYSIFIGLGILLLYLSFRGKNFSEIKHYIVTANYYWVAVMLLLGFIALFMRVYRWNILIEPAGYSPKIWNTYHAVTIGYTANYALPRIGEVVRCGTLSKTEKIPVDVLLGTVIVERVFDVICLIVFTFLTLFLKLKFFGDYFKANILDTMSKKISTTLNFSTLV